MFVLISEDSEALGGSDSAERLIQYLETEGFSSIEVSESDLLPNVKLVECEEDSLPYFFTIQEIPDI